MKFSTLSTFVLAAVGVYAAPAKRDGIDDTTVLNYALTLENLENAFYAGALAKFDQNAFTSAGLPSGARDRFVQIGEHEKQHVALLADALGSAAVQPCNYSFPYTNPKEFAAVSQILEGVGVSAYAGAAQYISNKDYLTVAATILSTEARHAAYVADAVNGQNPWSYAFDTPLGFNQVYSLAAPFFVSCPESNVALPVKAFPTLTLGAGKPGDTVNVTLGKGYNLAPPTNIAFLTGVTSTFVPVNNGTVTIPSSLQGTTYAIATCSNSSQGVTDASTVAGPAVLSFPF